MAHPIRTVPPEQNNLPQLYAMLVRELREAAVFLTDPEGVISTWNPGVEHLLGFKEDEWTGRSLEMIFTPEDIASGEFAREVNAALTLGSAPDVRWHVRQDGSLVYVDGLLQALHRDDGTLLGFAKIMKDATARKRAEEERDHFFQLGAELMAVADFGGRFIRVEGKWTDLLGWSEQELTSRPWLDFVHPEDREAAVAAAASASSGQSVVAFEDRCLCKDGGYRWLRWKARFDLERRLLYGAATDVTEQKTAEQQRERDMRELDRRTAELNAILSSIPDAVYVGNENGIQQCNEVALRMLGFENLEDLQQNLALLAERIQTRSARTGEKLGFEQQPLIRALRGETTVEEVSARRIDTNEEVIVRCAAAPVKLSGRVVAAVAINTDITRQKSIEADRERLLAALQQSNHELSQFSWIASHDLQAPLRLVKTCAKLLSTQYKGRLDDTADECLSTITDAAETMHQLIRVLLEYAQSGNQPGELQPVQLQPVINAVLMNLAPELQETGSTVVCGDLPSLVADPIQLFQLFQNLISNAIKYHREGRPAEIHLSASELEGHCVFAVSDNGIGIEPRHAQQIFAPLKRLHGREIPGMGMGLAVCRKIVERNGGRIWVESQPGEGSTFYFTIPR